eukprot:TRINITY_DN13819_c0_g1_i1.p1 TRINITY_DN13819_c0_g1~~TRINITY_DN13819_c0_g1_i1.p1  ORF type:complete len:222 (-),score=103.82 TRINITY_DN13819_c0_g1_i1:131-796(-)
MSDIVELASLYERKSAEVNMRVAELGNLKGGPRKAKLQTATADVAALKYLLEQLDVALGAMAPEARARYRTRVSNFRQDFAAIDRLLKDATAVGLVADREELVGPAAADELSADERTRLLMGTHRLERSSQSIAASKRIAAECETIGQDIMTSLGRQRDTIERTTNMVSETSAELSRASKGITLMQRRSVTNKLILALVILGLLAAIAVIIWFKFLRRLFQ